MSEDAAPPLSGDFWILDAPERRTRGDFRHEIGQQPEVTLTTELVTDPRIVFSRNEDGHVTGWGKLASAAASVEAFKSVTLHGLVDSGLAVTVLSAHNHGGGGPFNPPRYLADVAVLGAHVEGDEQLYSAVRFRVDHPYWLWHLSESPPSTVTDDQSTLAVEIADEGNWLVYASSVPTTLRELDICVVSACLALFRLAIDRKLEIRETQVRIEADGPWFAVDGAGFSAPPYGMDPVVLPPREELTVERLAKWIVLNETLDGLAWSVARPVKAVLQIEAMVAASPIEGLHRRLPYQQLKFPGTSNSAIDGIKRAARHAAAEKAETSPHLDPQSVKKAVMNAVSHLEQVDYSARAADVVNTVRQVIPEITESVPDLPALLVTIRNDRAHHLPSELKKSLDTCALEWMVIATVTPWLLRALLLLNAGVDTQVLHDRYIAYQRFSFFRANTAKHVRELGWKPPAGPD